MKRLWLPGLMILALQLFGATATFAEDAAGGAQLGRDYFTGAKRFTKGGPPCISCHTMSDLGAAGGGNLAVISATPEKAGGSASLDTYRGKPNGGMMVKAFMNPGPNTYMGNTYKGRELADEEFAALDAYFATPVGEAGANTMLYPIAGLALAFVLLILFQLFWSKRVKSVRKSMVEGGK